MVRPLWPQVLEEKHQGPGRPPYRKRLADLLDSMNVEYSERDLKWVMEQVDSSSVQK